MTTHNYFTKKVLKTELQWFGLRFTGALWTSLLIPGPLRVLAGEGSWSGCERGAACAVHCELMMQKLRNGSDTEKGWFSGLLAVPLVPAWVCSKW